MLAKSRSLRSQVPVLPGDGGRCRPGQRPASVAEMGTFGASSKTGRSFRLLASTHSGPALYADWELGDGTVTCTRRRNDAVGTDNRDARRDIARHNCIRTDHDAVTDAHVAEHARTCTDVDVVANQRRDVLAMIASADRHLLHQSHAPPDDSLRMDDDAVGMRQVDVWRQPALDVAVEQHAHEAAEQRNVAA